MTRRVSSYAPIALRLVELALCAVVAAALVYTVQAGFNIADSVHGAVWLTVLVCLALQALLTSGVGARGARVGAYVAFGIISLGACAASIALAPPGNPIADVPQNYFAATALFPAVNLVVFLLARRRATCVALLGFGAFVCGCTQFLFTANMLVATFVFVAAAGMLVAFRSYLETVRIVSATAAPLLGKASVVGTLMPLAACLAALLVAVFVIMPLNPPHATIKLFNEYLAYEDDRVRTSVEFDEDAEKTLTSSIVDDSLEPRTTANQKTDGNPPERINSDTQKEDRKDYLSSDYSDVDLSSMIDDAQTLALNPEIPWGPIIACLIALALLLLFVVRYLVHRLRLARIAARPPHEQISLLYRFFLSRFKKLGLEKPPTASPVEYANQFRRKLAPFVGAQEPGSFDHLTALLVSQEYAGTEPDEQDLQSMYALYKAFYRRCRKELGLFNYCFRRLTL